LQDRLIDDFSRAGIARNGQRWRFFSDRVMGGVSEGRAEYGLVNGRQALRLSGRVSLENNGGFIQCALDLAPEGRDFDAGAFTGIAVTLCGDGGVYAINLRSSDLRRPWQSYRAMLQSSAEWQTHHLPFGNFIAHRTEAPLDRSRLRRIGLIAIGEARQVDVAIAGLSFIDPDPR
jgi:hypothetical protein